MKLQGLLRSGLLALTMFSAVAMASEEKFMVRFSLNESVKQQLKNSDIDVTGINYNENIIEALVSHEELSKLQSHKANFKYVLPQNLLRGPDKEYQTPQKITEYLQDVHGRFPEITKLKVIGKSLEGRDIWAIKISENPGKEVASKPVILFNSMHHAREVMTPEVAIDIIDYLTQRYNSDDRVTNWVNRNEIWVIPMFNVDGNQKVWDADSMWRKNTRGGYGVDINRNYPSTWNTCNGSSSRQSAQDYRGPEAASEPETQAMMKFVSEITPVFNISYHSYSELVLYPYGCRPLKVEQDAVASIGKEMGTLLKYKAGTPWELLYNADGGDIDWMYMEHQVIPYVIEVNSTMQGFQPSYSKWRQVTVERNRPGWMLLLDRVEGSGFKGIAKKGEKSIEIYSAKAKAVIQNYRIKKDGSYIVILTPGEYELKFKGEGDKIVQSKKLIVESKMIQL
jgi:carboxypeptidase T